MTLREVVAKGDRRESLEALRDVLAARLEGAEPRESAPLAKQLGDVLRELDGLKPAEESATDDLAARRKTRRASVPKRPAGGIVGGEGSG